MAASNCSTRPVQDPHEAEALVWARTSSTVNSPFSMMALTMAPLHTPLQPHTSALSAIAATAFVPP